MAIRIVGVDLPQNKRGEIALTYIFGIGRSSSAKILDKAGVDRDLKVKDWTDDQAAKIRQIIGAEYKVESYLAGRFAVVQVIYVCNFISIGRAVEDIFVKAIMTLNTFSRMANDQKS